MRRRLKHTLDEGIKGKRWNVYKKKYWQRESQNKAEEEVKEQKKVKLKENREKFSIKELCKAAILFFFIIIIILLILSLKLCNVNVDYYSFSHTLLCGKL